MLRGNIFNFLGVSLVSLTRLCTSGGQGANSTCLVTYNFWHNALLLIGAQRTLGLDYLVIRKGIHIVEAVAQVSLPSMLPAVIGMMRSYFFSDEEQFRWIISSKT